MLKPILDTMKQANVESVTDRYEKMLSELEYDCYSCGNSCKRDEIEERVVRFQGEKEVILVCKKCISHGWDEWRLD